MRQVLYAGLTPPSLTHHGFLVLIRLDASYEEWIALAQSLHEGLQRLLELGGEGGSPLPCL